MKHAKKSAALLLCAPAMMCLSHTANAADSAVHFNIPAEDLGAALRDFGQQSNQQILFSSAVVQGKSTAGVAGKMAPDMVLAQLLTGSGLTSARIADGSLLIAAADAKEASSSSDPSGAPNGARNSQPSSRSSVASENILEEIVVTAQKREQNVQDVGISITALSGDQLSALGIRDTDTISNMTPGLFIASLGSQGISTFTLRGVSQNDFADQNEAPNAVYFDGAYNSFIGGVGAGMFDVERVEVLRGPQGTLFGRNATGGLIHVISRKPTSNVEGYGEVNFGQRNLKEFEGALSGPLTDNFLARVSVAARQNDGYITNTVTGDTLQGTDNLSGRVQLQWLLSDEANILLNVHGARDHVNAANGYHPERAIIGANGLVRAPVDQAEYEAFCNAQFGVNTPAPIVITSTSACSGAELSNDPYVTAVDNQGLMKRNTYGATGTVTVNLSDALTLVSVTDYLKMKRDGGNDTDGTAFKQFNFFSYANNRQYSEELRLQGTHDRFNWTAGLFYLNIKYNIQTGIDAVPDANTLANANPDTLFPFSTDNLIQQYTKSYALFGQTEFKFNEQFTLITGLRWSQDKKRIEMNTSCGGDIFAFACAIVARPGIVQGDGFNSATNPDLNHQSKGDWSGKVELDYRPAEDWLVFGSVNRGQKGGGFNASAIAGITAARTPYRPEVLTSYEMGFKSTLAGTTRLNASVFYYDYSNYQAYTLTGLTPTVFNTDATVKGGEVELQTSPVRGLDVALGVAYLDAMAHDVPLNLLGNAPSLGDQHMPQSPPWSLNGMVRYSWDLWGGRLAVQTDARYVGKRYFNTVNHPALTDDPYTLVNGRISYTGGDGKWEVALWGRNLTDKDYSPMGFDLTTTNGVVVKAISPPRWFGGSFSYHW